MEPEKRIIRDIPKEIRNKITWGSACLEEDTEIHLADGTFTKIQNFVGREIRTNQPGKRKIIRIHKFDTAGTDPPLLEIGGNWMTDSHFIYRQRDSRWYRAKEIKEVNKTSRHAPKGAVYAAELDIDDYLTLRRAIRAATFGNCLIVEPHRQEYTQDLRYRIDKALRERGLHKANTIEWYQSGVGHRKDGSLILDVELIKPPQEAMRRQEGQGSTTTKHLPQRQQREYRVCGRCLKPEATLKCACMLTHYCNTQCQREDMPAHRQECTAMILKEITSIKNQLRQHHDTHGRFTEEVAIQKLLLTELHIKMADLLRTSQLGTNQEQAQYHYTQALQSVAKLVNQTLLKERPALLYNLLTDQVAANVGLGCLYRDQKLDQKAMAHLTQAHDLTQIGKGPLQNNRRL